ncbi:MAG: ankyrin repeat domain-containing protein, partial [Bryobacteraceae bacterium]|nr:ankyrin repeat domain-containing protein [Bryobacteraceae bacterium]
LTLALAGGLLHAADPADLFTAIRQGNHALAARLAGNGADVNGPNPSGITPLLQAVLTSDLKMVRLLIAKGANVKAPGDSGIMVILECGHSAYWEQTDDFNRAVIGFIHGVSKKGNR